VIVKGGDFVAYRITEDCIACGSCAEECPADAIEEGNDICTIDQDTCTECGTCVEVCPSDAVIEE